VGGTERLRVLTTQTPLWLVNGAAEALGTEAAASFTFSAGEAAHDHCHHGAQQLFKGIKTKLHLISRTEGQEILLTLSRLYCS